MERLPAQGPDEDRFRESWFEPDLRLAFDRYFAQRRRRVRKALLVGLVSLSGCAVVGYYGAHVRTGALWPLGILLQITAVLVGFLALMASGAAGTQLVYDVTRAKRLRDNGRLQSRDRNSTLLEVIRKRLAFALYLRNFNTEESEPTPQDCDFGGPVDIDKPRWDSRLEDCALAPIPRDLAVVSIGFIGRDFPDSRSLEVFLADATWPTAFEWLARRASLIITVVDQETEGVEHECTALSELVAREQAPPIWMLLNSPMRKHAWAVRLAELAKWVTDYDGVPPENAPVEVREFVRRSSTRSS